MKIFNTASFAFFLAALFLSNAAFSQNTELNELKGYSPPPMFSGSSPSAAPQAPAVEAPAPQPAKQQAAQPIVQQPAPPKNIHSAEDILAYPANANSVPVQPVSKDLPLPTAVPAAKVETALPLPGSVAPSPKKKEKAAEKPAPQKADKKADNKAQPKKAEPKKPAPPAQPKKAQEKKKTEKAKTSSPAKEKEAAKKPPASETKKPAASKTAAPVKSSPKPAPGKTNAVVAKTPKIENKVEKKEPPKPIPTPAPVPAKPAAAPPPVEPASVAPAQKAETALPDLPVPDKKVKPYRLDGKKNMPVIKPTTVDKTPLPEIAAAPPSVPPSVNEQIIDKALQDRLMRPDVKSIIKSDAADKAGKQQTGPAQAQPKATAVPPVAPEVKRVDLRPSMLSIEYKPGVTAAQDDHKKIIENEILPKLRADKNARLQILAYASASQEGQSSARRLSLARSLDLRAYLLDQKIQPSRIDIRALGDKTPEKPLDRVDLRFIPSK